MQDHKVNRYLSAKQQLDERHNSSYKEFVAAEKECVAASASLISDLPEQLKDTFSWMAVVAHASSEFMPEPPKGKSSKQQKSLPLDAHLIYIATWIDIADGVVYSSDDPIACMNAIPILVDRIDHELNDLSADPEEKVGEIVRILEHFRMVYLRDLDEALRLPKHEEEYENWDADEMREFFIARAKFYDEHGDQYSLLDEAA